VPAGCLLIAAATLLGCTPRAIDLSAPIDEAGGFSYSGHQAVPDRWWTEFGSGDLNGLVDRALRSELSLKATWQRFRQARAVVNRESADLFPELQGTGTGQATGGSRGGADGFELGLTADYEVDLWGRIRSTVDAERFRTDASFEDYQAAALSLSAEVATAWFQLLEANARRDLLQRQIETNEKLLRQLRNEFAGGQIRSVDVLRQQQLVAATRQQKHATEATIGVLENRLAVLVGEAPQDGLPYSPARALPRLPPLPDTGVPVGLVRRRPDVRSAHDLLYAANRDVAAAISDQYPRLTLDTSHTTTSAGAEQLFENWAHSFAANLVAPLLDAGRRRSEVDRTAALERQRLYEYGQTILVAFREVEDALLREQQQIRQIRELEEQVELATKAYEQLLVEYRNGVADFIDVLTALTDQQQLQRDLLEAERLLLEFRISLYRALAGGFETNEPSGAAPPR